MKIAQRKWSEQSGWEPNDFDQPNDRAQLVLTFGSTSIIKESKNLDLVKQNYPNAHLLGCSTSGEIYSTEVNDDTLTVTAVEFEKTTIKTTCMQIDDMANSFQTGEKLIEDLGTTDLTHVFVLSDGINVNGSELVKGLTKNLPQNVTVTGGLSGDGSRFEETYVLCNNKPGKNMVTVLGFYGKDLKVGYASLGGWDPFGPDRIITKSNANILYELDNQSALELYKKYLGDHAKDLPASGLLFPLTVRDPKSEDWIVRTILGVNEDDHSMTFAGDVPEGSYARLMKANFERLIDGASAAAQSSYEAIGSSSPDLAILISCVGRKMVLKQRIEEEVEGVRNILGGSTILTGFYSYGEISPFTPNANCELHNQTMTITTLSEQ